jgi:hypothetical protein
MHASDVVFDLFEIWLDAKLINVITILVKDSLESPDMRQPIATR